MVLFSFDFLSLRSIERAWPRQRQTVFLDFFFVISLIGNRSSVSLYYFCYEMLYAQRQNAFH